MMDDNMVPAAQDGTEAERLRTEDAELQELLADAYGASLDWNDLLNQRADEDALKRLNAAEAENADLKSQIDGYREWGDDVKRLTRQIDVDLHGEDGAALQASLCDLVGEGAKLRAERDALKAENERLRARASVDAKMILKTAHDAVEWKRRAEAATATSGHKDAEIARLRDGARQFELIMALLAGAGFDEFAARVMDAYRLTIGAVLRAEQGEAK